MWRTATKLAPSVFVTVLPVVGTFAFGQPLYRVFLYYAIEIVVLMIFVCCVVPFVAPERTNETVESSLWTVRGISQVAAGVGAVALFLIGVLLNTIPLLFLAVVVGVFSSPQLRVESVDWTLKNRLRFALGIAPLVLLWTGIVSILLWQVGVVISRGITGNGPQAGTAIWVHYLNNLEATVLVPAVMTIVVGSAQTVFREAVRSGKIRHTTPKEFVMMYMKVGVGVPVAIWFGVLVTVIPALVIVFIATAAGYALVGTAAVFGWVTVGLGLYVLSQSYVDWRRLQAQQAWKSGEYETPLVPSEFEITAPVLGRVTLSGRKKR